MRILYVCNDLPYFNAHRQWLAAAARQAGAEVLLATGGVSAEAAAADPEVIALDVERHRFDLRSDAALAVDRRAARHGHYKISILIDTTDI